MKAHRPCPKCSAQNHVRRAACEKCGAPMKEVKFADPVKAKEAGKKVMEENAPVFKKLAAAEKVEKVRGTVVNATPENRIYPFSGAKEPDGCMYGTVLVPAGAAPIKLKNFEADTIQSWAEETCRAYKYGRLTYGALEYFARKFYDYPTDKKTEQKIKDALYGL
jgi:hypothetical protein